jgi:hypothetical protein
MKIMAGMLIAAALAIGSGCATSPDWIERTLVTVDVTGAWYGKYMSSTGPSASFGTEMWLDLQQDGPKVKGSVRAREGNSMGASLAPSSGPLEGTVTGDVFSFRQTDGSLKCE